MGKFLAGLATLAVSLAALWLMVIGLGLIFLGVPPGGEEIARSLVFLVVAIFYAGVWLVARDAALDRVPLARDRGAGRARHLAVPDGAVADAGPAFAQVIAPPDPRYAAARTGDAGNRAVGADLARLSPNDLFGEAMLAVLSPTTRRSGRCSSTSCTAP